MRQTYYTLATSIKPGWTLPFPKSFKVKGDVITAQAGHERPDPTRWPELPHAVLANLDFPRAIGAPKLIEFMRTYGPPLADLAEIPEPGEPFEISVTLVGYMQDQLRRAWQGRRNEPIAPNRWFPRGLKNNIVRYDAKTLWFPQGPDENRARYDLPMMWGAGGISLRVADCWTYLRLLLTRDLAEKRARFCKNPTCPEPHFIAKRNNQKFCTRDCANVIAQRNFRKRRK
jgi:hypothetical protein